MTCCAHGLVIFRSLFSERKLSLWYLLKLNPSTANTHTHTHIHTLPDWEETQRPRHFFCNAIKAKLQLPSAVPCHVALDIDLNLFHILILGI